MIDKCANWWLKGTVCTLLASHWFGVSVREISCITKASGHDEHPDRVLLDFPPHSGAIIFHCCLRAYVISIILKLVFINSAWMYSLSFLFVCKALNQPSIFPFIVRFWPTFGKHQQANSSRALTSDTAIVQLYYAIIKYEYSTRIQITRVFDTYIST